jgi:hypothetical protein
MRTFIVTVQTEKDIKELVDLIANRVYTLDGVKDVEVVELIDNEKADKGIQYGY